MNITRFLCIRLILQILIIPLCSIALSQTTAPVLPNNVPPSPTAASLGQYGEIEVGHYSGLPNIDVPLYTYLQSGYSLNIGLAYQSVGLRYLDEASFVGLGWSLYGPGVITRSIKGVEDLMPNKGFSRIPVSQMDPSETDGEPDIFYYNVNGKVGKFLLPYAPGTKVHAKLINQQEDIQIYLDDNNNFTLITPDGITYRFDKKEMSHITTSYGTSADRITSWFLSSIKLTNGESINFTYKANTVRILSSTFQTHTTQVSNVQQLNGFEMDIANCVQGHINSLWLGSLSGAGTVSQTDEVLLDRIEGKNGKIEFTYVSRNDIAANGGTPSRLQSMIVKDKQNVVMRTFTFSQSYFSSGNSNTAVGNRLKLTGLSETGNGVNNQTKSHVFAYYEGILPDKTHSTGKYYGFYDSDFKCTLLKKITYPTKGYTEFIYENHTYHVSPNLNITTRTDLGVRIRQILNFDVNGDTLRNRQYNYERIEGGVAVSTGKLISFTTDIYNAPVAFETRYCTRNVNGVPNSVPINFNVTRQTVYSSSIVPLGGSSTVVGYDQVTVVDKAGSVNSGKTEYYFINNTDHYPGVVPGLQGTHDYKNGTLTEKREYRWDTASNDFKLLRKSTFEHQFFDNAAYIGSVYLPGYGTRAYGISCFKSRPIENVEILSESTSNTFEKRQTYIYSSIYLLPEIVETVNSAGTIERITKRYPYHFASNWLYSDMVSRNQLNPVIEESRSVNGFTRYVTATPYRQIGEGTNAIFVPDSIKTRKSDSGPFENRIVFSNYTANGKLLHAKLVDGPPHAYQWGYGQEYVVAEMTNGNNSDDTYHIFQNSSNLIVPITMYSTNFASFTSVARGDIIIQLMQGSFLSSGSTLSMDYELSGPKHSSGTFCMNSNPSDQCYYGNTNRNRIVITDAPAGTYQLLIRSGTTISGTTAVVSYTYMGGQQLISSALKDFFYEGFEEVTGAATTTPYAGKRYRSGTYTVPFTKPDGREYMVEYRYLQNGKWIFQKKVYQNNMTLNEGTAIDEVRIYPTGSGMSTYTYEPLKGMTSKTDETGTTMFYEYDAFQRLYRIRDDDGNILEEYKYNYRSN